MAIKIPGYRIIRKINHGGMSTVYLAIQISVGRVVALKVMNPGLTSDPTFNERFQREATTVGQLSHPNIISIYDIGREDSLNYIAMDYLPGGSVHDKMIEGLNCEEALRVTKDIANALNHSHEKGYIHRDIKPENILFRADNSAVLTDFGVAKGMIGVSRMTHVGTVVGTPHYMSPEQARGQVVDARSDLYSLGVVFYEMLTGSLPYPGEDAVTIVLKHISAGIPTLPRQLQVYQKLLDKFLAKDPAQRFQTGHEITDAIEKIEANKRTTFNTLTASDELSITLLFSALVNATRDELFWQWQNIKHLRWSKEKGFHQEISNLNPTLRNNFQPTVMASRAHHATHINRIINPNNKLLTKKTVFKGIGISLLGLMVWCTFSVMMFNIFYKNMHSLPTFIQHAATSTAKLFLNESEVQPVAVAVEKSTSTASQQNLAASSSQTESISPQSSALVEPQSIILADDSSSVAAEAQAILLVKNSSAVSSEPEILTYALTIKVQPEKSQIKLLNVPTKYKDGVELTPGKYLVEMSKAGYTTKTEWIEIKNQAKEFNYMLSEMATDISAPTTITTIRPANPLAILKEHNKPEFIRIPAGSFIMGDNNNTRSTPVHTVNIPKPFAIGKYEVTFNEYDVFVKATNRAQPGDNNWGRNSQPVIHVSWADAQAYTEWLSLSTGKKYRLPTEAEWEYVARAGTKTRYWWGNEELDAKGLANCRRGCYSSYSGLFGSKTAPVGSYPANPFGVNDTAGNVAEWVQDCFQDHYETTTSSAAFETKECQRRVVRGGSTKNNAPSLASAEREDYPAETYNETIGFRVVMEY